MLFQSVKYNYPVHSKKVGNLLVYLSKSIDNLYLTKLLKLIYIIDETSVKECGSPVTNLVYKVWEKGPVATDIYYDLTFSDFVIYPEYINRIKVENAQFSGWKIESKKEFDDSEFSDYEIELFDRIIKKYGSLTANQLIDKLHEEGSLWHKIVIEKNLEHFFKIGDKTTNYEIHLNKLIEGDSYKSLLFDEVKMMGNL